MNIDFITFCHPGDYHRLYANTWLIDMIASHEIYFDTVRIVHQRCAGLDIPKPPIICDLNCGALNIIPSETHPNILTEFGYPEEDPIASRWTHGPTGPHFYVYHNINHLIGLKVSDADYIVFSDSDCTIKSHDPGQNWIRKGIDILQRYPEILIVSPGDGATMAEALTAEGYRLTQNVSQQLFLCSRQRLKNVDFNIPWNWEFLAPGGPFQEFYYLLEGRIWRYMHKHGLWRCVLPDHVARYWHFNKLTDNGLFETDYEKY
jgi:hypothetical protein